MQYRKVGKTEETASALGFGIMRLPGWLEGRIDEVQSMEMVVYAIDNGVTYLDTAFPYINGLSEPFIAKILNAGYRDKVTVATKLPQWEVKEYADFEKYLNMQLERLGMEQIDYYLVHAIDGKSWSRLKALGILDWLTKITADGRVKHIGFSFHDDSEPFEQIVNDYDWEFCQIQYNYLDRDRQAGFKGLKLAGEKSLGVIIMEPLLGGTLANLPDSVNAIFQEHDSCRSSVDWALQWLWDQPEVSVVLSGMSTIEQVKANVASACRSSAGSMSHVEKSVIDEVTSAYQEMRPIHCTNCQYCLPCPQGVYIPKIFEFYNHGAQGNYWFVSSGMYNDILEDNQQADQCVECGLCEEACPQHLDIIAWLKESHLMLKQFGALYDPTRHPEH